MTFTKVFTQLMRRKKNNAWVLNFTQQEKLNDNGEEGYKIQTVRCLFFNQKTYVKVEKEETLTH